MSDTLYNDYKNNCCEYLKTVSYTEKIIKDNNSDQNKLLNIYEKAINSAESMFKRMQIEVETNAAIRDKHNELNSMQKEISEYKTKLKNFREEFLERNKMKNDMINNYDDRILLLSDVDLLEKGDVYINQSKILMNNSEYISNDIMINLNKQKECIKKNIGNISFLSNKLDNAKTILESLKNKDIFNKYRLYIIYLFIFLTFSFIICIKYNRYVNKNNSSPVTKNSISLLNNAINYDKEQTKSLDEKSGYNSLYKLHNIDEANSIIYDFIEKKEKREEGDTGKSNTDTFVTDKNVATSNDSFLFKTNESKGNEKEDNQVGRKNDEEGDHPTELKHERKQNEDKNIKSNPRGNKDEKKKGERRTTVSWGENNANGVKMEQSDNRVGKMDHTGEGEHMDKREEQHLNVEKR
ncbi:vesicle transport v-SNARE protein VTI1, putative [Plasmodium ovale curtisi]|uniref:Vesicle transport v-SNARE protein VTI1, putative n=1 Tax=Plasmodium ovale curtisi TaxID=864141 RepID=A0A1A8WZU7_PLAOA|nr:vesicle transport v-SNARE protein VTI1, putative [Plasmodium ovale curtisi]